MRAIAVVGSLILVAALTCLWWSFAVWDEMPVPGAPRDTESAVPHAAGLAEASVQASPAANEREGNIRTAFDANALHDNAADSPFALIGRVLDDQGKPIENAVVTASPGNWYEVYDSPDLDRNDAQKVREHVQGVLRLRRSSVTDADGRFRIGVGGPSAQIELRVQARGRITLQRMAQRPAKADVDLGILTLARGAVVAGRVVDRAGRPVVAARVSRGDKNDGAWGYAMESPGGDVYRELQLGDDTVSGEEGAFELPNVPPGEFSLFARHANHPPARLDGLTVAVGAVLADLLVVVEPGTTIRGRVLGSPAGVHLHALATLSPSEWAKEPNAQQWQQFNSMFAADFPPAFGQRTTPVSTDGSFVLNGLAAGRSYRVWAVQEMRERSGPATCCGAVDAPAGGQGIELRYDSGVAITCRLIDDRTGAPIEEAWVRRQIQSGAANPEFGIYDRGGSERFTCPNGQLTFASLRPKPKQTLTLAVEAVGYAAFTRENIALPTAGVLDLGTLRLAPIPVVRVLVTIAASGVPLAGSQVRLQVQKPVRRPGGPGGPAPLTRKTDDQGRCTLNSRSDEVRLYVTAANFAPFTSDPLTLPADADTDFHAKLVEGGVVHVTAVDADGAIARGVSVLHRAPDGTTATEQVDANGCVTFARLAPGQHGFRITADGDGYGFGIPRAMEATSSEAGLQSVDVDDGKEQTLKLTQEPQAILTGIVSENGLALAGARVGFVRGSGLAEGAAGGRPDMEAMLREREQSARAVTTDALGHYELKGLVAGDHRLQITHESRAMPTRVPVSLQIGPNVANVDLTTAILRGVVRDPAGKPVAEATVNITTRAPDGAPGRGGSRSGKTGADGRYELRGVQHDTDLVVRARAAGFAEAAAPAVRVESGMTRAGIDITLAAGGCIEVRTAAEGRLAVTARREGGDAKDPRSASAQVSDGKALLKDLLPGRWRVSLRAFGPGSQPRDPVFVEVMAGQTAIAQF